ncbi:TetR/AcrR family transcriptional regulator [Streptomyces sp. NPDC059866]|uniref:TetR/AcrR family transcriptional regulator n=1 Tax=Streptomyces sp. NPDC059866 TaxID=3346978 RepID=UPI003648F8D3
MAEESTGGTPGTGAGTPSDRSRGGGRPPIETLLAQGRKHGVRKQVILRQAARLFRERGYARTAINDIGEAAGITGPAVYRHFSGKQAILSALVGLSLEQLQREFEQVVEGSFASPTQALEAAVDCYLDFALGNRDLAVVVDRELTKVPAEGRRRFTRINRLLREDWVHLLTEVRPDLSDAAARVAVTSVMGMVLAVVPQCVGLADEPLRAQLRAQALAVLLAPAPPADPGV